MTDEQLVDVYNLYLKLLYVEGSARLAYNELIGKMYACKVENVKAVPYNFQQLIIEIKNTVERTNLHLNDIKNELILISNQFEDFKNE